MQVNTMALKSALEDAKQVQKGLFLLGRNRMAALPAHSQWDLTDDLEWRIKRIISALEKAEG